MKFPHLHALDGQRRRVSPLFRGRAHLFGSLRGGLGHRDSATLKSATLGALLGRDAAPGRGAGTKGSTGKGLVG